MYKVGLALPALVFLVFFLPCPFFSPSSSKLAVVSHLFKMNQLKVNFGLLRDLSFLAARMRISLYVAVLELFLNFNQIDSKNKPIGDSAHARRHKGGVPEEAEIGRTHIPF